ncbi:MAG: hypothetical protein ABI785_14280 [Gemmatimonadales bacterium]
MRSALTVSLMMSGLLACSGATRTGHVADGPVPASGIAGDTLAQSASLVRRLAEAADGFRDGRPRWVVIHRRGDKGHHDVRGVFMTFKEASFEAERAGPEYAAFGPFVTKDDPPDLSSTKTDVVEVIVRQKNGVEKRFSADSVDALFWSLAAFDKFIAPYLTSVDGVRYAAEQRELYRIGESPLARSVIVHKAGSF